MDDVCTSFESERIEHENLKRQLRKGYTCHIRENMEGWKCQTCDRILLSKVEYVNHRKSHQGQFMHTPGTNNAFCAICNKVCKSASGLKRHMVVHKHHILSSDPADPVGRTSFLCHICIKLCGSIAGLKSHLRAHERKDSGGRVGGL